MTDSRPSSDAAAVGSYMAHPVAKQEEDYVRVRTPRRYGTARKAGNLVRPARAGQLDAPGRAGGVQGAFELDEGGHVLGQDPGVGIGRHAAKDVGQHADPRT